MINKTFNAEDLVSEPLYPGLFKTYEEGIKVIEELLHMHYDSSLYYDLSSENIRMCYESMIDMQEDSFSLEYETFCIGYDLSEEDSDTMLKHLKYTGGYLGYHYESGDKHDMYTSLLKPALKLRKTWRPELYREFISAINAIDDLEIQYDNGGMCSRYADYGIDYNSPEFRDKAVEFLELMCKSNKFSSDVYEKYSDVIDFFILYRYERYDLDIDVPNSADGYAPSAKWKFALGYDGSMFEFVSYGEYNP